MAETGAGKCERHWGIELGISEENITVGTPRQDGGFGRKLMNDNSVEAAIISAAAKCHVQVQWTR